MDQNLQEFVTEQRLLADLLVTVRADSRLLEAPLKRLLVDHLMAQNATLLAEAYEILNSNGRVGM